MTSQITVHQESGAPAREPIALGPGSLSILVLSGWCGLVSGLLEVGITIVRKHNVDSNHFYWMSRHFVWLIPLTNLLIFLVVGAVLSVLVRQGRVGRWIATRTLGTLFLLPLFWAAFPRIYGLAGFVLVLGGAMRLLAARGPAGWLAPAGQPELPLGRPDLGVAGRSSLGRRQIDEWREAARPMPAAGSPNVLLVIFDTVGASHLSLYGHDRRTSPTVDELAARGVRFDRAQAPSPWTLPSHASMFTGRWPHELSAGWLTPLDGTHKTVAEFMGSRVCDGRLHRQLCILCVGFGVGARIYAVFKTTSSPS